MPIVIAASVALGALLWIGILAWLENSRAAIERAEDEELQKQIERLPEEMQVRIWNEHLRQRANS